MPARYSIEYEFSDALAKRAAGIFVRDSRKDLSIKFWRALPTIVLYAMLSGLTLLLGYLLDIPDEIMVLPIGLVAFFGGILFLLSSLHTVALLFEAIARWRIARQLAAPLEEAGGRAVRWQFDEGHFEVHSAVAHRTVPWDNLRSFHAGSKFWVLGVKDGPNLLLPLEFLDDPARKFVQQKTAAIGKG